LAWGDFLLGDGILGGRGALTNTGVLRFAQKYEQQLQQQIMATASSGMVKLQQTPFFWNTGATKSSHSTL
jgi:hypothetical protein